MATILIVGGGGREHALAWRCAKEGHRVVASPGSDAIAQIAEFDQNMRRRSIYFFIKRSQLIPMMMLFDWPEHLVSIGRRSSTTIAPQALLFLNSPQARQYAEGFAGRLAGLAPEEAIARAYPLAFGRPPVEREAKLARAFLRRQQESYEKAGKGNAAQLAMTDLCQALLSMNEFVYID